MASGKEILERYYLEMRWRCLSLAADLDRVERGEGGAELLRTDPRMQRLQQAFDVLKSNTPGRAEQVQSIFTDKTPPPAR